jgi:peptide/nickel transport system substrate-binding protein
VLVSNDKWWAARGGPSKVTIRVNTDAKSASQQLQNEEVDIIATQADGAVAQQLHGDPSIRTFAAAGQTYEHIDFRMDLPLFTDKAVREAVAACVNRQDLIDKLVRDVDPNAKPLGNMMFMPNEAGYEDHYAYTGNGDVEAAKRILTAAGYTLGTDGVFAKNGQRVSFRLGHRIIERRSQTARLIQSHCAPAGIEVIADQAQNFNDVRLKAGDFDVALFAWVGTAVKSSAYANCASADAGGSSNYNKYSNKQLDRLYAEANAELDFDKRIRMVVATSQRVRAEEIRCPQLPAATWEGGRPPTPYLPGRAAMHAATWRTRLPARRSIAVTCAAVSAMVQSAVAIVLEAAVHRTRPVNRSLVCFRAGRTPNQFSSASSTGRLQG